MLALVILASLAAIGLLLGHRGGARVVARAVTPDRAELCVVQQPSSDSPLWFKTSFVFRQPGGSWQRFYFHHEDRYWMGSRVSLDTNAQVATFSRGGLASPGRASADASRMVSRESNSLRWANRRPRSG